MLSGAAESSIIWWSSGVPWPHLVLITVNAEYGANKYSLSSDKPGTRLVTRLTCWHLCTGCMCTSHSIFVGACARCMKSSAVDRRKLVARAIAGRPQEPLLVAQNSTETEGLPLPKIPERGAISTQLRGTALQRALVVRRRRPRQCRPNGCDVACGGGAVASASHGIDRAEG